jgi:hypothetical protein
MDAIDPDEYEAHSRADGTWPDAALDEFAELCRESGQTKTGPASG